MTAINDAPSTCSAAQNYQQQTAATKCLTTESDEKLRRSNAVPPYLMSEFLATSVTVFAPSLYLISQDTVVAKRTWMSGQKAASIIRMHFTATLNFRRKHELGLVSKF